MVIWFIRVMFVLMIASLIVLSFNQQSINQSMPDVAAQYEAVVLAFGASLLALGLAVDLLVLKKSVAALAGIFFGLLVGLLIGLGFSSILDFVYEVYNVPVGSVLEYARDPIKWFINIFCCFLSITFIMQTKDDFRFIVPYVEFSKQMKGGCPFILDTSVIIDGRIVDIAATKVFQGGLVVPRFVLHELQNIADSADRLRRNRGRRGLDILNKMQSSKGADISILDVSLSAAERSEPVDQQLVTAGLKLNGKLVTNDYNLNKVASLRGVEVVNINDLANALKPVLLPGEVLCVKMVKPGDQQGQGVGYLEDGTMVVVDDGRQFLGKEIDAVVTSVLQTSAGRMVFGKMEGSGGQENARNGNSEGNHNDRGANRGGRDNRGGYRSSNRG